MLTPSSQIVTMDDFSLDVVMVRRIERAKRKIHSDKDDEDDDHNEDDE